MSFQQIPDVCRRAQYSFQGNKFKYCLVLCFLQSQFEGLSFQEYSFLYSDMEMYIARFQKPSTTRVFNRWIYDVVSQPWLEWVFRLNALPSNSFIAQMGELLFADLSWAPPTGNGSIFAYSWPVQLQNQWVCISFPISSTIIWFFADQPQWFCSSGSSTPPKKGVASHKNQLSYQMHQRLKVSKLKSLILIGNS